MVERRGISRAGADGDGYPRFVEREFRRYLDCGLLCQGFARLRCAVCGYERLVAFSCKEKLCPSCLARRAGDTAAWLVDHLLPAADYRQWVLTFPWTMRFRLATLRACRGRLCGWLHDIQSSAPADDPRGGGTGGDGRASVHRAVGGGIGGGKRLPRPEPGHALRGALLVAERAGGNAGPPAVAGAGGDGEGGGRSPGQAAVCLGRGILAPQRAVGASARSGGLGAVVPLRAADAPLEWTVERVYNHPRVASGCDAADPLFRFGDSRPHEPGGSAP